ncbi:MAG: hypothetical protein R3202_06670, partial [Candidatus Competibacterales bacterium]|nr:hypothetical protein [Candidatus Competibacterales bacterium]
MPNSPIELGGLRIDPGLYALIRDEIAPGTGVEPDAFWQALGDIVRDLRPRTRELLTRRDELQAKLDAWYLEHKGRDFDHAAYTGFLREIGYLVPEGEDFAVSTADVDPEIATVAGPQLVVPVDNARYALNAANARWGSLYDALYGTDVIPEDDGLEKGSEYNPRRGARVFEQAAAFLDEAVPLDGAGHGEVTSYALAEGGRQLQATLQDG